MKKTRSRKSRDTVPLSILLLCAGNIGQSWLLSEIKGCILIFAKGAKKLCFGTFSNNKAEKIMNVISAHLKKGPIFIF
jgi:hypothetical protein